MKRETMSVRSGSGGSPQLPKMGVGLGARPNSRGPIDLGSREAFGVAIDCLKHTYLVRSQSAQPKQQKRQYLDDTDAQNLFRKPSSSGKFLNQINQHRSLTDQNRVKSAMTSIIKRSTSPAVVRMYSAAIRPSHELAPMARSRQKKSVFSARPQSHLEAMRGSRRIIAIAALKEKIDPAHVTPRKASELVVDNRPRSHGVLRSFERRIQRSGLPPEYAEEPMPYPLNPFRPASPRADPENVYSPEGVEELLEECHRAVMEADEKNILIQKHAPKPTHTPPSEPLPTNPRASPITDAVLPPYVHDAEAAMRQSHKSSAAPTRSTLSARERIIQVKAHLHWKKMTEDPVGSEAGSFRPGTSAVANVTNALDLMKPSGQQRKAAAASGGRITTGGDGGGEGQQRDGSVVAAHRRGIVKHQYNMF